MRQGFDFMCALAGLILLSPVLVIIWLAVVLESGCPGFFRQKRVGRDAQSFLLYKFRSMADAKAESGKQKAEIMAAGRGFAAQARRKRTEDSKRWVESGEFDAGDTSRVTSVGRFLRKTKLDELPQLWNVLKGDMSLVGPRPEVRKWVEVYPERWARVLTVRPGITDPASIEFRHEEKLLATSQDPERTYRDEILPRKLALYEQYVATWSFWGDIAILIKTFWTVLTG